MKLHRNIRVWYVTTFFSYAAFTLPIWVIFNTQVLGLSNIQAYILAALPLGLSILFEIPAGSWSDKYGRVKVYRLGTILYIISVASFIFFTDFNILAFLQVVGALGLAMQSGGLEALVHDSIGKRKDKDTVYARVHANMVATLFSSRVITCLLSGFLFTINPKAPFIVAVAMYAFGFLVSLIFKEVRTETSTKLSHAKHIKETFLLLMIKKSLMKMFILTSIYLFCVEALFVQYQPYFASIGTPIAEFGIFYAVISLFSVMGALSIGRLMKKYTTNQILLAMIVAVLTTLILLLTRVSLLTYVAVVPASFVSGFLIVLMNTSIQRQIHSKHQATALSLASFTRRLMIFTAFIAVGILLDHVSVLIAMILLTLVTAVFCMVFIFIIRAESVEKRLAYE